MEVKASVDRFLTGMPIRFSTASEDVRISGVVVKADAESGEAFSIERYQESFDLKSYQSRNDTEDC
jgi:calcineurin-like phosphoesterase